MGRKNGAAKAVENKSEEQPESGVTGSGEGSTVAVEVAPPAAALSKEAARELFLTYEETCAALLDAESKVEDCARNKSDAVKAIAEGTGRTQFNYKGREITISARKKKAADPEGAETLTYFFKVAKQTSLAID